jgi:hypothetical protein
MHSMGCDFPKEIVRKIGTDAAGWTAMDVGNR